MIQKENFYVVIGAYVLLFMLILPIAVGTWWYNTMRFSNNNVLLDTIRYFCVTFMRSPYMAMPRVIKVLSNAYEFNPAFNKEIVCRPSDNTELPPLIIQIPIFTIFKKAIVGSPSSVKTRALIYAHLERIDLPAKTLYLDKQYVIKNSPRLIDEMINSLLYVLAVATDEANLRHKTPQHLATIENCMHLVPMLVQALSDNASPLLQLPHIGQTQLRHMAAKQRNIKSIRQLVRFPDDKRRALLRSLSDEQYRDMLNVCASMPMLTISYRCEVLDDDDPSIWPLSMVTATVLLQRTPLFEPSAITSATTFQDLHYNGSGSTARSDSSAYDHVFNSQLYPAANPAGGGSGTVGGSVETGFDGANSMGYGDLGDEYPDMLTKPKKSATPVWDKGKRKKPTRKKKQPQQQRKQQQKQTSTVSPTEQQPANENQLDSDLEEVETVRSKALNSDELNENQPTEDGPTDTANSVVTSELHELDEDMCEVHPANTAEALDVWDSVTANGPLSEEKLAKNRVDKSNTPAPSSSNRPSKDSRPLCTHVVHCPYFPVEKFEGWWVYLVDRRTRQLITKPVYVATLQTEEEFTVSPLPERVVRYLKEQEEAHSDSSAASSDSEYEGEEGATEDELSDAEVDQGQSKDRMNSNNGNRLTQDLGDEEEEDDEDGDTSGQIRSLDEQRLSDYLSKV
ncbi:Translocation protein SEC63 protein [Fasciola hepatica]|uniref:Translocation protein SEC63 protein n=1 Tax=Fasciola hepatica TaxID=6192 RepID=A0A4E0R4U8_FASHE|nr:Translocation protein SEC63 protein [Fasciola hepatica]